MDLVLNNFVDKRYAFVAPSGFVFEVATCMNELETMFCVLSQSLAFFFIQELRM